MGLQSWKVAAIVTATSNVARVMSESMKATMLASAEIEKQNSVLKRRAAQEQILRDQISKTQAIANVARAGFGALAVTAGAAIFTGVKGAADLQQAMMSVAVATGTAVDKMGAFYKLAFNVSGMTAQSVTTIAQELSVAASNGLRDPKLLQSAFPRIAKAADVMWLSPKHLDPIDSVRQLSTMAHLFGAYSGAPLQHMLDRSTQLMFSQPEALQAAITQGRLFIGPALARGVTEEDLFRQILAMGQTGNLRSRGGSGLANVIEYLAGAESITDHMSKARRAAFQDLGVWDAKGQLKFKDENGHLLLGKAVDYLYNIQRQFDPLRFSNDLRNAFGAQGGRYMSTILRPSVYEQTAKNWAGMNTIGGVDDLWKKYTSMFNYQWSVFATNFENVFKTIFLPLLPRFTSILKKAGEDLGGAVKWLSEHPREAGLIGGGIMTAFAAGITGVAATSVIAAANVWNLNRALAMLSVSSEGAAVGNAVGAGTKGGLISGVAGFFTGLFQKGMAQGVERGAMGTGALYPEVAAILERAGILRIAAGFGARLIPFAGWALGVASGMDLIVNAVRKMPYIITAIHNWWVKNRETIGYTIGYVFGTIGHMLQAAISGLLSMGAAAIKTAATNYWLLATPGGQAVLEAQVQVAMADAAKQWAKDNTPTFGNGYFTGLYAGANGQAFNPHGTPGTIHIENMTVTGIQDIKAFQDAMHTLPGRINISNTRTTGASHPTHPSISRYQLGGNIFQ